MATVSMDEAAKTLPDLLQRACLESIVIQDEDGRSAILLSLKPKPKKKD